MNKRKASHSCEQSPLPKVGFCAFKKKSFRNVFIKPVAVTLIFTFSYSQLLYAADVRQLLLDAESSFEEPLNRRGGSPDEVIQSQAAAQSAVDSRNEALTLANNQQFSLTTQNGDTLNYINGKLTSALKLDDGTSLNNIELNDLGQINNANIKLQDGSILLFKDGNVSGYLTLDGRTIEYNADGNVGTVIEKDGLITTYHYDANNKNLLIYTESDQFRIKFDSDSNIRSISNKITGDVSTFVGGRLRTIYKGKTREMFGYSSYSEGGKEGVRLVFYRDKLKKVHYFTWKDGKMQLSSMANNRLVMAGFSPIFVGNIPDPKTLLMIAQALRTVDFITIDYDENNKVKEIRRPGEKLFFQDGILERITDKDGNPKASFDYDPNILFGTSIVQNNASSIYDQATGRLSEVKVEGFTIHYKEDSDTIDYISHVENKNGVDIVTKLTELEFDEQGAIKKVTVLKDDEERVYSKTIIEVDAQGEKREITSAELTLVSVKKPDETEFDYGKILGLIKPISLRTPDKFIYDFDYTNPSNIVANLKAEIEQSIPELTARSMEFDDSFNLRRLIRENNEILSFQNNKLISIDNKTINYGDSQSYSVVDGNSETFYDADGSPLKAVITEEGKVLNVEYAYGKIRNIYRGDSTDPVFEYSYETDSDGKELTLIHDNEEKVLKKYKEGNLTEELNEESSIRSLYTYYADNEAFPSEIKEVKVTRLGNTIQTYRYSYDFKNTETKEDDLTIVTEGEDEDTIVRVYSKASITVNSLKESAIIIEDANTQKITTSLESQSSQTSQSNKLLFLERNGVKYSYKYHVNKTNLLSGTVETTDEMVEEELIEKKLSGNAVAYYEEGNLVRIELNDGTDDYLTDIGLDENRKAYKATLNIAFSGIKKVFTENRVSELILPTGEHYYYTDNLLSKVVDPILGEMAITYTRDAGQNIQTIWVEPKDSKLKLKYDSEGALQGLRLNDFMTPEEVQETATNSFESFFKNSSPIQQGIESGPDGRDGDFDTSQYVSWSTSFGQTQGSGSVDVVSIINLEAPQTITELKFRFGAWGRGWGAYSNNNHGSHSYEIFYQQGTNEWVQFQGASGSNFSDTGTVSLDADVQGVTALKARVYGYGEGSDQGGAEAGARIYEIQFTSADQASYGFSSDANGYGFTGYAGQMHFNSSGQIVEAAPQLTGPADVLKDKIQNFKAFSHKEKINISNIDGQSGLFNLAKESVLKSDNVVMQEYSSAGVIETQVKANKLVTVFENNKPFQVLDEKGTILMEYFYDGDNLARINLKNARDSLPGKIDEAENNIERERANALRDLSVGEGQVYLDIKAKAEADRETVGKNISALRAALNDLENTDMKGSKAKKQKSQQLDQIRDLIRQQEENLRLVNRIEADSYAQLKTTVREYSNIIEAEANSALNQLRTEEANLKKEILRQEVSPIIYDYYRRIIGRDPSSQDYEKWISKLDYETGRVKLGEETRTEIIPNISASFDGDGDYLSVQDNDTWVMSSTGNNMTFDFNVKLNSIDSSHAFVSHGLAEDDKWQIYWVQEDQKLRFYAGSNNLTRVDLQVAWVPEANKWYNIALVKEGNKFTFYIDGVKRGSGYFKTTNVTVNPNSDLQIGHVKYKNGRDVYLNGHIDQLRISNIARWQAAFTPSTLPAETDAATTLLIQGSATSFIDKSGAARSVSLIGGVEPDKDNYKLSRSVEGLYSVTDTLPDALTNYFETDPDAVSELRERETYVGRIKSEVEVFLNNYLSSANKASILQTLGLATERVVADQGTELEISDEVIELTNEDKNKIIAWFNENPNNLHFGQSAFLSLEKLLEQKLNRVMTFDERIELAKKAILIDILTGVITPLDKDSDLVISINALNRTAQLYGLDIVGAKLNWEDLRTIFQNDPSSKVIAHINGNHFVIVTAITENSITYIDPGIGKDKENESLSVTKEGFLETWKGYVTFERAKLETASLELKVISAQKAMTIRGAFWGSVLNIIGAVLNIILPGAGIPFQLAAFAVSIAEGDWISAIASIVNASFAAVGQGTEIFRAAFDGFTHALGPLGSILQGIATVVEGIGTALTAIFQPVTGFFTGILGSFGTFLSTATGALADIARTAVSLGVNIGVSKGLEALGLSPELAGFLGSLTAGAAMGGMEPVDQTANNAAALQVRNIQAYMQQTITIIEVGRLGVELGVDPLLTNIISLSLAAIQGAQILSSPDEIVNAFKDIKANIFSSLGQYGFDKLAIKLGLDSEIMHLIGTPIASAAGARLVGNNAVNAFNNGLARGATSIAINYATQELELDPLVSALSVNVITGSILGAFRKDGDILKGAADSFKRSALNFLNLGGDNLDPNDPSYAYLKARYLANIIDFSDKIQDFGLEATLESYATQIFTRDAVENIWKAGGILDFLTNNARSVNYYGTILTEVDINGYKVYFNSSTDVMSGRSFVDPVSGRRVEEYNATYGFDENGHFGLKGGQIIQEIGTGTKTIQTIQDGSITHMEIVNENKIVLEIRPYPGSNEIILSKDGQVWDGIMIADNGDIEIYVSKGQIDLTSADSFGGTQAPITVNQSDTPYDKSKKFLEIVDFYANLGLGSEDSPSYGYSNLLRSIILTTGQFGIAGDLADLFAVDESQINSLSDYAEILFDMYLSPDLIADAPTLADIARYQDLEYGLEGEFPQSIVSAIHGTGSHTSSWADHLNGLKVDGEPIQISAVTWNFPGTEDGIGGFTGSDNDPTSGIKEYLTDPVKKEMIKDRVYHAMLVDQQYAKDNGLSYDVVAHSQGTMIVFDILREHGDEFQIRNLVTTGSPLKWYIDRQIRSGELTQNELSFPTVQNWLNVYNENDVLNTTRSDVVKTVSIAIPNLDRLLTAFDLNKPVSGPLNGMISQAIDLRSVDVQHTAMWKDSRILAALEPYWKKDD